MGRRKKNTENDFETADGAITESEEAHESVVIDDRELVLQSVGASLDGPLAAWIPEKEPKRYRVLQLSVVCSHGHSVYLPAGTVVSDQTHDMIAIRAQNVPLAEV